MGIDTDDEEQIDMDEFAPELQAVMDDFVREHDDNVMRTRAEWIRKLVSTLTDEE